MGKLYDYQQHCWSCVKEMEMVYSTREKHVTMRKVSVLLVLTFGEFNLSQSQPLAGLRRISSFGTCALASIMGVSRQFFFSVLVLNTEKWIKMMVTDHRMPHVANRDYA